MNILQAILQKKYYKDDTFEVMPQRDGKVWIEEDGMFIMSVKDDQVIFYGQDYEPWCNKLWKLWGCPDVGEEVQPILRKGGKLFHPRQLNQTRWR